MVHYSVFPNVGRVSRTGACIKCQKLNACYYCSFPALEIWGCSIILEEEKKNLSRETAYKLLQQCEKKKDLRFCRNLHSLMILNELDSISVLGDHIIRFYAYHGRFFEANRAFNKILEPTSYTWAAAILSNAKLQQGRLVLELCDRMRHSGARQNQYTYVGAFKACKTLKWILDGRMFHERLVYNGLELNVIVGSAVVDMYAKCGKVKEACRAFNQLQFRDTVAWNSMVACYAQNGEGILALKCFSEMEQEGIEPNEYTYSSCFKACASIGAVEHGRLLHDKIMRIGLKSHVIVGSSLVEMYVKCAKLEEAYKAFNDLPSRTVVSWNSMIGGYAHYAQGYLALECFEIMLCEGVQPDEVTFFSVLKACACAGAVEQGKLMNEKLMAADFELDVVIGSSLIDMYAKCGSLKDACRVFHKLPDQNVISWGVMIGGYAQHGECTQALECFEDMQRQGISPDEGTFTSVLVACSRVGLVDEGYWYFNHMKGGHRIKPTISHCTCMVDLLGRSGYLNEAEALLQFNVQNDAMTWLSLLSFCCMHGNVELGGSCFDRILCLDPHYGGGYVLMSNLCANQHKEKVLLDKHLCRNEMMANCRVP